MPKNRSKNSSGKLDSVLSLKLSKIQFEHMRLIGSCTKPETEIFLDIFAQIQNLSTYISKLVSKPTYTQRTKNTVTWHCCCHWPNRCVLSARRNCPSVMSDSCSWVGRLFHTRGPATANEQLQVCKSVCWFAALSTCRCPTNAVVGVQWQTQIGSLLPGMQARGCAVVHQHGSLELNTMADWKPV